MRNTQDIVTAWHVLMYATSIPMLIMLIWFAIKPKDFDRWKTQKPQFQRQSEETELFVRIVCGITAIGIIVFLAMTP